MCQELSGLAFLSLIDDRAKNNNGHTHLINHNFYWMPRHIIATVKLNKDAFQCSSVKYWGRREIISSTNGLAQIEQVLISALPYFLRSYLKSLEGFLICHCFFKKHKSKERREEIQKLSAWGTESSEEVNGGSSTADSDGCTGTSNPALSTKSAHRDTATCCRRCDHVPGFFSPQHTESAYRLSGTAERGEQGVRACQIRRQQRRQPQSRKISMISQVN